MKTIFLFILFCGMTACQSLHSANSNSNINGKKTEIKRAIASADNRPNLYNNRLNLYGVLKNIGGETALTSAITQVEIFSVLCLPNNNPIKCYYSLSGGGQKEIRGDKAHDLFETLINSKALIDSTGSGWYQAEHIACVLTTTSVNTFTEDCTAEFKL